MVWFVSLAWAVAPQAPAGRTSVHHAELEVSTDERPVPVRLSWPSGDGPFPVIVFSHGLGGSGSGYRPLVDHWVAHGFVVAQPTHADSVSLLDAGQRAKHRSLEDFARDPAVLASWSQRPVEVARVLDALPRLAEEAGLGGRLDMDHVGVGGHSFGAHTTMMVGGLAVGMGGRRVTAADPRVDALVILSPQGPGRGLDAASYAPVTGPSLVVTGPDDRSPIHGKDGTWRRQAYDAFGPGDHTLLWLEGTPHNLGGISGVARPGAAAADPEVLELVKSSTLAFWQLWLGGDDGARARVEAVGEHPRATISHRAP